MDRDDHSSIALRVAATGDLHATAADQARIGRAFASIAGVADLVLLAGDLTTLGQVDEARVVADACSKVGAPVVAVLGNHDWHSDLSTEIGALLADAGVIVLDRSHAVLSIGGTTVGIAGVKGFIGGFTHGWANFGEPLFRDAYTETTRDVEALDAALVAIAGCAIRIALLHYSPCPDTLAGEPERLWLVLGSERLATPIIAHRPQLVVHGHAHHGSFEGDLDGVPIRNVARHVTGSDFQLFEIGALDGLR